MKKLLTVKLSTENKKLENFLKATKKELDNFFNSSVPAPTIFLLNSREELDIIWGQKTERWVVGGTKYRAILAMAHQYN